VLLDALNRHRGKGQQKITDIDKLMVPTSNAWPHSANSAMLAVMSRFMLLTYSVVVWTLADFPQGLWLLFLGGYAAHCVLSTAPIGGSARGELQRGEVYDSWSYRRRLEL
jgi:hypothetical protein